MDSLASAGKLLARCDSAVAAAPLLGALGFDPSLILLGREHRARLGVEPHTESVHLAVGRGALRALVFEPTRELRDDVSAIGRQLATRASELLWLLVAVDRTGARVALATVDASRLPPRIAALVVNRNHIVDSDSETLGALAASHAGSDLITHLRWSEALGRESVNRSFYRTLERMVRTLSRSIAPCPTAAEAGELALLCVSRLLFLSFLETRGWLDGDHCFLANQYADCMVAGGGYHLRVLAPLFFGTLNTAPRNRSTRARAFGRIPFLNGGLFSRSSLERRHADSRFSDEALGDLFGELLTRYRFTAREDSATWSEAAIDPEMLGKAFENLMSAGERKRSGAFYTPQSLVAQVSAAALSHALSSSRMSRQSVADALAGEEVPARFRAELARNADELRVLDPACGSGAFLVHTLELLSHFRSRLGESGPLHRVRRRILVSSIFGVDVNPIAVWLCELRLRLSMAIEDPERNPMHVPPLPNLDRNIRVGNSLSGDDFREPIFLAGGRVMARLRARYSRATGPRKQSLGRSLDAEERRCALSALDARITRLRAKRRDLLAVARTHDLFGGRQPLSRELSSTLADTRELLRRSTSESRRISSGGALPFSFVSRFADVAEHGGFDIVVGNPPWVRTHNLDRESRELLRQRFDVYRNAAWQAGSNSAAAGRGFSSQVDAAALFIERSVELLRPRGIVALLVPAKLWRSLAGGGVRDFLLRRSSLEELHDLTSAESVFDAAVYPSIVVARKGQVEKHGDGAGTAVAVVVHREGQPRSWMLQRSRLALDASAGSPWMMLPPDVRSAFDTLAEAGVPLSSSLFGRPLLGVKTGCNDAFLVRIEASSSGGRTCRAFSSGREGHIERECLRPAIRGEDVTPWAIAPGDSGIVWTHDVAGRPRSSLPSGALEWLRHHRRDIEARTDARRGTRWWSVFRTESAGNDLPRVVWPDIGRRPRAAVLEAGDPSVPINSCYAIRCPTFDDALGLAALINSGVAAAWLSAIAEPARGRYRRYMGWTMGLLPLPREWLRARSLLAPVARLAVEGVRPDQQELDALVLSAFGLRESHVSALMAWSD